MRHSLSLNAHLLLLVSTMLVVAAAGMNVGRPRILASGGKKGTSVSGFGARNSRRSIFSSLELDPAAINATTIEETNVTESDHIFANLTTDGNRTGNQPSLDYPRLWIMRTDKPDALLVQTRNDDGSPKQTLKISMSKESGDWQVGSAKARFTSHDIHGIGSEWVPVEGLYGFYRVPSGILIVLIAKSELVFAAPPLDIGNDSWWNIRRVTNLELVHIGREDTLLSAADLKEEVRQLRLLRKSLKQHDFYFASNACNDIVDISKTLQRTIETNIDAEARGLGEWWEKPEEGPDSRFFWNSETASPLLERYKSLNSRPGKQRLVTTLLQSMIPVSSAFVSFQSNITVDEDLSSMAYHQLLISRRSRYRAGTRFTRRGADASGAVANYAETEQICLVVHPETNVLQQLLSHVQVRGSIPLRWSSPTDIKTYRPRIRIGMDPMAQARALGKHLVDQHS